MRSPRVRVGVVVPHEGKLLLVRHNKGDRQYWMLPGGGLDYGETFERCAIREVREETGFEVAIDRMLSLSEAIDPRGTRHILNIYMLARITGGTLAVPRGDIIDQVDFLDIEKLHEITLFPAIAEHLQAGYQSGFKEAIAYLGSLWVD